MEGDWCVLVGGERMYILVRFVMLLLLERNYRECCLWGWYIRNVFCFYFIESFSKCVGN